MDMITKQAVDEALRSLPQERHEAVDSVFLEKYADAIETVKSGYEDKGGIHVLRTDEGDGVICRVPSADILRKARKNAERISDPIEQDMALVNDCLLYPSPLVFRSWVEKGNAGLASTYTRKLLELSKTAVEAEAKKL